MFPAYVAGVLLRCSRPYSSSLLLPYVLVPSASQIALLGLPSHLHRLLQPSKSVELPQLSVVALAQGLEFMYW
jgi:hypothetical protein